MPSTVLMNYSNLKEEYRRLIEDDFIPFWISHVDNEYGGILNCLSNDESLPVADDKFTWSQGRWLWIVSMLYQLRVRGQLCKTDPDMLLSWMHKTYSFIREYAFMPGMKCCYLLSREGEHLKEPASGTYDASIYADCFVLIGFSQYAIATEDKDAVSLADRLCESIIERIKGGEYRSEPYPVPEGYRTHGIAMILLNALTEYSLMKERVDTRNERAIKAAEECLFFILEELYDENKGVIREFVSNNENRGVRLLDRHLNPGHMIEDLWFQIEYLQTYGSLDKWMDRIVRIAKTIFSLSWDSSFSGIFRYIDLDGGRPKGESLGTLYEKQVLDTWDMKLWWVHSEPLYTYLLLYSLTGDEDFERIYTKAHEYAFSVFPDRKKGEWIQTRDRKGEVENKIAALPVKDPFHILRDFIKIVLLAERMEK